MRRLAAVLGAALAAAPGAAAACALELILALDVSGSIDESEYRLQRGGLADALRAPEIVRAVEGLEGGILLTLTQWSGIGRHHQTTGWHHAEGAKGLVRFAEVVDRTPRRWRNFSTAIGEALIHAEAVSATAPRRCARRVIDVSGDGVSNEGRPPRAIADRLAGQGYTINGLAIRGAEPDPLEHFHAEVIAGPGAFVEAAEGFAAYPRAIRRKLLREIAPPLILSGGD